MKTLAKLAFGAALATGVAMAAAAPAQAGIDIGINLGGPGYYHGHRGHWCYYHPGACEGYGYNGGYADGYYWGGHGYWHEGHWWGHRDRWNGGWRYR